MPDGRMVNVRGIRARFNQFDVLPLALHSGGTNFAANMGITGANVSTARRGGSKLYGANGTFFYVDAAHAAEVEGYRQFDVYRIQMSANSPVASRITRDVGDVNLSHAEAHINNPCGTFVVFNQAISGTVAVEERLLNMDQLRVNGNPVPISNIRYAIGGTSLRLSDRSLTDVTFSSLMDIEGASGVRARRPRTAMVYTGTGDQDTILLTVYGSDLRVNGNVTNNFDPNTGVTLWELRQLIIDRFIPAGRAGLGVGLDGGGSTQLHVRQPNGIDHTFSAERTGIRNVSTMITVPM